MTEPRHPFKNGRASTLLVGRLRLKISRIMMHGPDTEHFLSALVALVQSHFRRDMRNPLDSQKFPPYVVRRSYTRRSSSGVWMFKTKNSDFEIVTCKYHGTMQGHSQRQHPSCVCNKIN